MTVAFVSGTGRTFRPPTSAEFDFRIESQVGYQDYAGSDVTADVLDASVRTITTDYSDPYYDINVLGTDASVTLTALDATGSLADGRLTRVSDGDCRVVAKHPFMSRTVTLDMSRVNDNEYQELVSYLTGSLAKHVVDQTTALISGKTAADMPIYTLQNHAGASYTRNTNCWAAPLNLTAISPWNSRGGAYRAGTAITPRHVLLATHYPLAASDTIRFVAADNTVVDRTIESVYDLPQDNPYDIDVQIAKLNADLPASITPLKFLPANAYDYLPSWHEWKIPLLYTNQFEKMACGLSTAVTNPVVDSIRVWTTTEAPYATMYANILIGDSGSPVMLVVNGSLVLVSHWTSFGVGNAHHKLLTEIATALTTLGGGHSLSTVDLSSFTDYS